MLTIKNITKKFGGITAVNDVTFSVEKGSTVGLIGPNGSGKTTLFNVISGVYSMSSGSVEFDGIDISKIKSSKIAQLGMVRTFQIVKPFNNISCLDNVITGAFQRYKFRQEAEDKAEQAMELLGIYKYKDMLPTDIPLGVKKKLEIARIISTEPKMILLDEVMGGLNPRETEELMETIARIKEEADLTVLIIEHKMQCIIKLAHDVVVLNDGKMIAYDKPENVVKDPGVIKAYLGDDYDVESY